ncbi:MAG: GntR family transcriptional regulator [Acetobacteraceae bacterium]|nr:GntR family transcriptional regulator [Acetobacteraceae bacterium]MDW8398168.1 GntR family transcriptional regulator [Acetobacteraceae bacterium]
MVQAELDPAVLSDLAGGADAALPKHVRLREALRGAIASGRLPPGTRLPAEPGIAAAVGASVGTVQRALRALAEEGLIARRTRAGSVVVDRRRPMERPWHCRFLSDDGETPLPIFPRLLARRVLREDGPWRAHLGPLPAGALLIERAIDVGGEFTVASAFYADPSRVGALLAAEEETLSGANLKLLLASLCGLTVTRARHRILARPEGGLRVDAYAWAGGTPLYFQRLLVPPTGRVMELLDRA